MLRGDIRRRLAAAFTGDGQPAAGAEPPQRVLSRRGLIATAAASGLVAGAEVVGSDVARGQGGPVSPTPLRISTRGEDVNGVVAIEEDGDQGIASITDSSHWSAEPPMRFRVSREQETFGGKHFLITPYEFGIALEYNGVMELWADEVSVHNNQTGGDIRASRFWVGNHDDTGGFYASATKSGGEKYVEVASQLFSGASSGDLRFIVRDGGDRFQFRAGLAGAEQPVAEIDAEGKLTAVEVHSEGKVTAAEVDAGDKLTAAEVEVSGTIRAAQIDTPQKVTAQELAASGKVTVGDLEASNDVNAAGRVTASRGLAVGNSVRARKPGRVVRRIAVFDEAGDRLGYLPVYDRIGR